MTGLAEVISQIKGQQQQDIISIRNFIASNYPDTLRALKMIDLEYTQPKRRKGFSLVKVLSKKHGFIYYARFSHNGKTLPTKFHTHTNDELTAEKYALENKAALVDRYLQRKDRRMFIMLENFYKDRTDIYNLNITERCRREYHGVILNKFIPFLEKQKISCFEQLSATALIKFQDHLLSENIKPQSVNNKMFAVKKVMASMFRKGMIKENPAECVRGVPVCQGDKQARGCYDLDKIKGIFNKRWKDDTSLLLCLLIYATGLRNSEINRIKLEDIISIGGCRFIWIKKSKTLNGVRMVPLHDFVYRKLKIWVEKNCKTPQSPLFDYYRAEVFNSANLCLAMQLGVSSEKLEAENITFYSGRHFWKTMMSCEGLGEDIEEIFMGHKVSGNVAKLYNHRDKQGKKNMVKKAKQVFAILDRCVFKQSRGGLSQRPQGRRGSSPRKTTPKRAKR